MKKNLWVIVTFFFQGCAPLIIGAAGLVGGVAISEDTVQSTVDAGYSQVWNVALNELEKMGGEVTLQDRSSGHIEAKIRHSKVFIHVDPITDKSVRFTVKARKNLLPHIRLAHDLSSRILKKL